MLQKTYINKISNKTHTGYLEGNLLIATPLLQGSCFEKSVIYVCAHNETGAMGILINHTLNHLKYNDIMSDIGINQSQINCINTPIHFGGPVETSRGFILHTNDYSGSNTQTLHSNIALTSTIDILNAIAHGKGPSKRILALGCAGWGPGQIEQEMKDNAWIIAPADQTIIFDTNNEEKWQHAANLVGVNFLNYSVISGSA